MRKALVIVLSVCLVAAFVGTVSARDIDRSGTRMMKTLNDNGSYEAIDLGARGLETSAALDTVCLAWYGFESMNWMGWTREDNTEQVGTFFHVDDFAGGLIQAAQVADDADLLAFLVAHHNHFGAI